MRISQFEDLRLVPPFNVDLDKAECEPVAVGRLRAAARDADGLLFSTPENNRTAPAVLVNAIEWLSIGRSVGELAGKPVALLGIDDGERGTRLAQRALRQVLYTTDSFVLENPVVDIRSSGPLLEYDSILDELLAAFVVWIELHRPQGDRSRGRK